MTKKVGSAGRFGPRYGVMVRKRVAAIEKVQKSYHTCPFCQFQKVKRVSSGIWNCRKCGRKFAGGSYIPVTEVEKVV